MRRIVLLGSTGSIGTQTLDVVASRRDQFEVTGLAASGGNPVLLADQIARFAPARVALARPEALAELERELEHRSVPRPLIEVGDDAATRLAGQDCDVVLNAITGAAGLLPTLVALEAGTTLALANKESLVIGGRLVTEAAAPGQLVAVDSEHSAFAQALRGGRAEEVTRLILTASGGPFRGRSRAELAEVTAAEAMAHPTWDMGRVITINSATLVNKGLELIEAALLYGVAYDDIVVTVHPQSVVHSMVEFCDGSTLAQASPPDMRLPIGLALTWPNRLPGASRPCDWSRSATWTFEPLDAETFPAVELARRAGKAGGTAPAVYNAANEVLVDAFCQARIGFLQITELITRCLEDHFATAHVADEALTVQAVLEADAAARDQAAHHVEELS
ncbi:MAG: 1-deoxy-D-xylulose-5-phosphate reductoisomerase [Arachnia propionica]|uniref:1-deoxy-D-xylulose-5-phosphate reductoisomerase n=1 Tax=Arachnia propionica TaxID=1750 RepID=UPI002709A8B8|nr:1-deoxy-D-xylulose-5-phosphate reductoisomerase [Arachnia propionica]